MKILSWFKRKPPVEGDIRNRNGFYPRIFVWGKWVTLRAWTTSYGHHAIEPWSLFRKRRFTTVHKNNRVDDGIPRGYGLCYGQMEAIVSWYERATGLQHPLREEHSDEGVRAKISRQAKETSEAFRRVEDMRLAKIRLVERDSNLPHIYEVSVQFSVAATTPEEAALTGYQMLHDDSQVGPILVDNHLAEDHFKFPYKRPGCRGFPKKD